MLLCGLLGSDDVDSNAAAGGNSPLAKRHDLLEQADDKKTDDREPVAWNLVPKVTEKVSPSQTASSGTAPPVASKVDVSRGTASEGTGKFFFSCSKYELATFATLTLSLPLSTAVDSAFMHFECHCRLASTSKHAVPSAVVDFRRQADLTQFVPLFSNIGDV